VFKLSDLRKRRREDEDLWPISLADMMTLLLCFFLLIVAVSHVDLNRYERVADSMQKAMITEKVAPRQPNEPPASVAQKTEQPKPPTVRSKVNRLTLASEPTPPLEMEETKPAPTAEADATKPEAPVQAEPIQKAEKTEEKVKPEERTGPTKKSLEDIRKELTGKLSAASGTVDVTPRDNGVELNLRGAAFFDLASAEIKPGGLALLRSIGSTLVGTNYKVTIEGHTDNLPMESWLYPSNWELSSARASRVARYLIDNGVPRDRIRVAGLADTQPLVPNTDNAGRAIPENQAKNRRVVILVSPEGGK